MLQTGNANGRCVVVPNRVPGANAFQIVLFGGLPLKIVVGIALILHSRVRPIFTIDVRE